MIKSSLCAVIVLGLVVQAISHRTCQHHNEASQVIHKVPLEPKHHVAKRALDQPIRISEFYDSTVNSLEASFRDLIKLNVVPKVIEFLSMTLQVRRTEVPILLGRSCVDGLQYIVPNSSYRHCSQGCAAQTMCGTSVVPESHLQRCCESPTISECDSMGTDGAGVSNADFVLYVSANSAGKCSQATATGGTLIAFAGHCQQEAALDRPIAGSVNLCPDAIQSSDLELVIATVKHELLHAMGFSSSLYPFFHDEDMMPRTRRNSTTGLPLVSVNGTYQPDSSTVAVVTRNDWSVASGPPISYQVNVMVTPAVQREARDHFNCDTLEGAELENQGGDATAVSHWEKRLFENEAMTGIFTNNPVFSRVTLALLEDSGWYRANYSMAGTLAWGRNLGCDFVFNSCRSWLLDQIANGETLEPFCNIPRGSGSRTVTDCTFDHLSVGVCNLVQFNGALQPEYQYFDTQTLPSDVSVSSPSTYGGNVQIADFCPFVQQLTFTSNGVAQRETECSNSSNQISDASNFGGELYGTGSRCFQQGGPWSLKTGTRTLTAGDYGSGCYRYSCTQSGLKVEIQGIEFDCSCKGETLMIDVTNNGLQYQGSIICPACSEVCWDNLSACPTQEPASCYGRMTDTGSNTNTDNNNNNGNGDGDGDGGAHGLHASLLSAIFVAILFLGLTI